MLVLEKDKIQRTCVDYRDINAQTDKDAFPLSLIGEVWLKLSQAQYFDTLDLIMGYKQVLVEMANRQKTAFITLKGLFVYNVMLFGLCNAPG